MHTHIFVYIHSLYRSPRVYGGGLRVNKQWHFVLEAEHHTHTNIPPTMMMPRHSQKCVHYTRPDKNLTSAAFLSTLKVAIQAVLSDCPLNSLGCVNENYLDSVFLQGGWHFSECWTTQVHIVWQIFTQANVAQHQHTENHEPESWFPSNICVDSLMRCATCVTCSNNIC